MLRNFLPFILEKEYEISFVMLFFWPFMSRQEKAKKIEEPAGKKVVKWARCELEAIAQVYF